jgi:hypothetical protein
VYTLPPPPPGRYDSVCVCCRGTAGAGIGEASWHVRTSPPVARGRSCVAVSVSPGTVCCSSPQRRQKLAAEGGSTSIRIDPSTNHPIPVVRCGAARHGAERRGRVRCGTVWCGAVRHDVVRRCAARHAVVRCRAVRLGTVQCDSVRCAVATPLR